MVHKFGDIISIENLLLSWQEFVRGKKTKPDVKKFDTDLIDNILQLHQELANKTYKHGGYHYFKISDPKPRDISKASVRDRLVHHAIYRILYPFFDRKFIADSYSCRLQKGTHRAIRRLQRMYWRCSENNTHTVWVLKLDIKKFFASIDHKILLRILNEYIIDEDIIWLLKVIISSFSTTSSEARSRFHERSLTTFEMVRRGLPLGNLTSQLFVNVYMNQFDQFVKHKLKIKYYIRYADDIVILSPSKDHLIELLFRVELFLRDELKLVLHSKKVVLKTFVSGVDFLGWVNFSRHRVLRTVTKKRMFRCFGQHPTYRTLQSYLGLLKHGSTYRLKQKLLNLFLCI